MATAEHKLPWLLLLVATALGGAWSEALRLLDFFCPIGMDGGMSAIRSAVCGPATLLSFLAAVGTLILVPTLAVTSLVNLIRWRLRRALFFFGVAAATCSVVMAVGRAAFPDPYFWYVLTHEAQLEAQAKSQSTTQPALTIVETRDVSRGLVINGNTFISIVYDASDEMARDPKRRLENWNAVRTGLGYRINPADIVKTEPLLGHFYLVVEHS